jgi:hypothetical protein
MYSTFIVLEIEDGSEQSAVHITWNDLLVNLSGHEWYNMVEITHADYSLSHRLGVGRKADKVVLQKKLNYFCRIQRSNKLVVYFVTNLAGNCKEGYN